MPPLPESTAVLAAFAAGLDPGALSAEAEHAAARLLLDTLGCMIGGANSTVGRLSRAWMEATAQSGTAVAGATVVGGATKAAPLFAGYCNGRMAAVLDADETYPSDRQTSHLAAAIVAAALAICEDRRTTRAELLAAIVAGYEVGARISDSMVPANANAGGGLRAGWGPGSVLGATAAAGRARRLAVDPMAEAFGIAGTHIDVPPLQWSEARPAPMLKSADAGWHALTAIAAVGMAELGMTGYRRILDGDRGLWRALGYAAGDADAATDRLGTRWIVGEAAFKRWPCQYWMHPALTALWRLLRDEPIAAADIETIALETNDKSLSAKFADREPAGEIDRAFSFPHAAAMIALGVPAGPAWSDDRLADDARVRRLRGLVSVARHPDAGRIGEWVVDHRIRELPARATVTAHARAYSMEVRAGLGDPFFAETRLSDDALIEKFREMTTESIEDWSWTGADAVIDWVLGAPPDAPVADLTVRLPAAVPEFAQEQ